MTMSTAPTSRIERNIGSSTEKYVRRREAPSIAAASSSSIGNPRTNPVVRNTTRPMRVPIIMRAYPVIEPSSPTVLRMKIVGMTAGGSRIDSEVT